MTIRNKILLLVLVLFVFAFAQVSVLFKRTLRIGYLEAQEEVMIDNAYTLANVIENLTLDEQKYLKYDFKDLFKNLYNTKLDAKVYNVVKKHVNSGFYLTDKKGIVIFDSQNSNRVGANFYKNNDVYKTLHNSYGARASRIDKKNPMSDILYVSAPIKSSKGEIIGVLSIYKSLEYTQLFYRQRRANLLKNSLITMLLFLILAYIFIKWLTTPIMQLHDYVQGLLDKKLRNKKVQFPELGKGEIAQLGEVFEKMRVELEGKNYIENYIQSVTHELKSPIAGVQGAVEILLDYHDLPEEQRAKFLNNIANENKRMTVLVERLLILSRLENLQNDFADKKDFSLLSLLTEISENWNERLSINSGLKPLSLIVDSNNFESFIMNGNRELICDAVNNLISNAVDFTSQDNRKILLKLEHCVEDIYKYKISVIDNGYGIPDYAIEKVFDKFYSLPRKDSKKKSSGLGLSITKQIVELHNGKILLEKNYQTGVAVTVYF